MRPTSFFPFATFLVVVVADYDLWYRSCGTGLSKLEVIAASDRQGPCSNKACSVGGLIGAGDVRGGNPCNGRCQDDLIYRLQNDDTYDIIVANSNIKIGYCRHNGSHSLAACRNTGSDCTMIQAYRCITHYCHEPVKRDIFTGRAFVA
ncbi:hypothetical protein V8F06_014363 [Rhypophila decipiens]